MFKKIVRAEIILLGGLVLFNSLVYWVTIPNIDSIATKVAPEGMKLLAYCDGRVSEQFTRIEDNSCIAEYPGEFAKEAILKMSIVILIIFPALFLAGAAIRKHLHRQKV